jgi:hypothetical protein
LRLWGLFAGLGLVLLGLTLRAWRSRRELVFWLRAWALWMPCCFIVALLCTRFLRSLPLQGNAWSLAWADAQWQLEFWYLASLPLLLALCRDLMADKGGFQDSATALWLGLGLAPIALEAFPFGQILGFLEPLLLLSCAVRFLPGARHSLRQSMATLASLNALGFVHGLLPLPAWLGGLLLSLCLALGLDPYGSRSALAAAGGSALLILLRYAAPWQGPGPVAAMFLGCLLILLLWRLAAPRSEGHRA